jgi:hypothetical protein
MIHLIEGDARRFRGNLAEVDQAFALNFAAIDHRHRYRRVLELGFAPLRGDQDLFQLRVRHSRLQRCILRERRRHVGRGSQNYP